LSDFAVDGTQEMWPDGLVTYRYVLKGDGVMAKQVKLYAFRPVPTKGRPTRKTQQIESLLTYENSKRVAEVDTGVIYPSFDVAMEAVLAKNQALAKGQSR
jgi:hypothetical protein